MWPGLTTNILLTLLVEVSPARRCLLTGQHELVEQEYYDCPGQEDPNTFTACCGTGCCLPTETSHTETLVIVILSLIIFTLTTLLISCLCCKRCPLYQDVSLSRLRRRSSQGSKIKTRLKPKIKYSRP